MRLVVDTNIWISALLNPLGLPARVKWALEIGLFVLILSEPMIAEVAEVLSQPRFRSRYGIVREDIDTLIHLLRERGEMVPVTGSIQICRDPDDDMVIETALIGHADALVTRDDDLKAPEVRDELAALGIAVLTVHQLLAALAV